MEKNKTGKPAWTTESGRYLQYAISEIKLVVIGILIEFKVNERSKKKSDEIAIVHLKKYQVRIIQLIS